MSSSGHLGESVGRTENKTKKVGREPWERGEKRNLPVPQNVELDIFKKIKS